MRWPSGLKLTLNTPFVCPTQRPKLLTGVDIPHFECLVQTCRCNTSAVQAEAQTLNRAAVSPQRPLYIFQSIGTPHFDSSIATSRCDASAIRAKAHASLQNLSAL